MRNIRKFETYDEFLAAQEAVSGNGAYVEDIVPGFAYVKELLDSGKGCVFYNKTAEPVPDDDYVFGDIVYYVEGQEKLQKCYWSAFTPDMGEKVGLIVVPTNLAPDGNARMMPFGFISQEQQEQSGPMMASNPNAKSVKGGDLVLGANDVTYEPISAGWTDDLFDENQTFFNYVPGFPLNGENDGGGEVVAAAASVPGSEGEETNYQYAVPINTALYSSDVHNAYGTPNPYTEGEAYPYSIGDAAISPFLGDSLDRQDPAYLYPTLVGGSIGPSPIKSGIIGGNNYNAFSDFSGYTWTYGCPPTYEPIISNDPGGEVLASSNPVEPVLGAYFPHNYARMFSTDGTAEGDWYLPSMGEMGFVAARFDMIVNTIMMYLYEEGALNNLDTLLAKTFTVFTSTAGVYTDNGGIAKSGELLKSSVPGYNTSLAVYPVLFFKQMIAGGKRDGVGFVPQNQSSYIIPFAMIKGGEIQHTMGDYTEENGHQMKDIVNNVAETL